MGEIAQSRGLSRAEVSLGWLLAQPGVTSPIIGASKPGHIEDAVKALAVKLDGDDLKRLAEAYRPHGVAGFI